MAKSENQLSFIQWKDLKNIQDQTVYSFGLIVQKMRSEVTRLINAIGAQTTSAPLRRSNYVSLVMLFRIRESMLSIELLISKGLAHDAAVLLLSLMELRLEIQYVLQNSANADEWIARKKIKAAPWPIEKLFDVVFQDEEIRAKEKANYNFFIKLRNGDPMGRQTNFPVKEDEIVSISRNELAICLFCAGKECYQILKAAALDFADAGFQIQSTLAAIEELHELNKKLQSLQTKKPAPKPRKYYPGA